MGNQLLIRAFTVEVGDCFYVRIPEGKTLDGGAKDDFHILIDCGSKGSKSILKRAVASLKESLPDAPGGKKRLDLLVVTHEHQDHIKGFDPEDFDDLQVDNIWLSAAMDPDQLQAEAPQSLNLLNFATKAMRDVERQNLALSPALSDLVALFSVNNDTALETLRVRLPTTEDGPTYVHAGMTAESLDLPLEGATIRVLGPQQDIDRFYLGEEADERFKAFSGGMQAFGEASKTEARPENISAGDFHRLRSRMLSNAFAFAELASRMKNNTSTVLLIEWQGRRLLFVGDAEWEHRYSEGRQNGGWNVMWNTDVKEHLDQPIDFLKVGHHGSTNSTPWHEGTHEAEHEPSQILDAILPKPDGAPTAQALVSTQRKNYQTIPRSELLVEIGQRVRNTRNYQQELEDRGLDPTQLRDFEEFEKEWLGEPQPFRTDLEELIEPKGFVDVLIDPS